VVRKYKCVGSTMFYLPENKGKMSVMFSHSYFPEECCVTGHKAFEIRRSFLVLFSFHSILFHDTVSSYKCTVLNGVVISKWCIGKNEGGDCRDIIQSNIPDFPAGNEGNLKKRERER
jgi:hypothetical protein